MFGKPKCKLRSKVVHFFVFCFSFIGFVLLLFEFYDDGKYVMDWGHCENTLAPSFLINSKIGMFGFVHPHKVITRRSAFSTFPNAQNGSENKLLKNNFKKKKSKSKVNLILSIVNHTFLILDPRLDPKAFRHTHCTSKNNVSFDMKKGPIEGSNLLQISPWALGTWTRV